MPCGDLPEWSDAIRILLVEDDQTLAGRLVATLAGAGFVTDHAADGDLGCYMGTTIDYDAIVLDLGLPKRPGLEVLRHWRAAGRTTPVLILTARGAWTERVEGLNAGADDYLPKPFQPEELIARLRALLRRSSGRPAPVLREGTVSLDTASGTVRVGDTPVALTAMEFRILAYLMHRRGRIVPQAELMDHVYGVDEVRDPNTIEVYVGRLRRKLGRDVITTVRSLGYRVGT